MSGPLDDVVAGEEIALSERARLVRLCTRLTGDVDAAEDLAQETLYEAWRNAHKLHDPAGRAPWLAAIARNVCLRWARARGRELARRVQPRRRSGQADDAGDEAAPEDRLVDQFDVEVELERHELARLLDRAMALLPPDTRRVLIERYVDESPQAETALRLGLSAGAVAMKLQRGKLALRRLLVTEFHREAAGFGLVDEAAEAWQVTSIWCASCGRRRLVGRFSPTRNEFWLRCPGCGSYNHSGESHAAGLRWDDVKGFRPTLTRLMNWMEPRYRQALRTRAFPCNRCGRIVRPWLEPIRRDDPHAVEVRWRCEACGADGQTYHAWLALCLPEGRRFYREQHRIRYAGHRLVHAGPGGGPALITSYESLTSQARLDVVSVWDTFEVLGIHGAPSDSAPETEEVGAPAPVPHAGR